MFPIALRRGAHSTRHCATTALAQRQFHQGRPLSKIGWVEVVDRRFDPRTKSWKHEDPEMVVGRIQVEVNSKGDEIRTFKSDRHTKPTTYKKELNNQIAYDRKKKQVMDLMKYIHFVKDHKDKDNW
ncbi:expressed unknown protein [Seminavis robusta]|uniref:Uncharacterized protein n=1 Tax=Seminavis robusta TaxID=568900 RepID=A0A9N8D9W9_9STRA|nr:expressed unknown protein [Seminavis robusta]|eukprot:Sro57_g033310.1 n/a (126) ;mRNA; r:70213-70590